MPSIMDVVRRNLDKRVDNIKSAGNSERRAVEQLLDDLTDLEIVEGPLDFTSRTTKTLARHFGVNFADNNMDLYDDIERAVNEKDINPRKRAEKIGGRY